MNTFSLFALCFVIACTTIDRQQYFAAVENPNYVEVEDRYSFDQQQIETMTEHEEKALNLRKVRFKFTNYNDRTLLTGILIPIFPYFENNRGFLKGEKLKLQVTAYSSTRGMKQIDPETPSFSELSITDDKGRVHRALKTEQTYNTTEYEFELEVTKLDRIIINPLDVSFTDGIKMQTPTVEFRKVKKTTLRDHPIAP